MDGLPDTVLLHIFSRLDVRSLCRLRRVSSRYHVLADDDACYRAVTFHHANAATFGHHARKVVRASTQSVAATLWAHKAVVIPTAPEMKGISNLCDLQSLDITGPRERVLNKLPVAVQLSLLLKPPLRLQSVKLDGVELLLGGCLDCDPTSLVSLLLGADCDIALGRPFEERDGIQRAYGPKFRVFAQFLHRCSSLKHLAMRLHLCVRSCPWLTKMPPGTALGQLTLWLEQNRARRDSIALTIRVFEHVSRLSIRDQTRCLVLCSIDRRRGADWLAETVDSVATELASAGVQVT